MAFIKDSGVVADTLDVVHEAFEFPVDMRLVCGGDDGPLYDPEMVQISVPYIFVDQVDARIAVLSPDLSVDDRDAIVLAELEHTLYHEIVHLLDLRFSGREDGGLAALVATEDAMH
jgi:hypothetical protein